MIRFSLRHLAASAIAMTTIALSGTAFAQYVWLDERGIKQFSDMPPPASVPANRVLKQPRGGTIPATSPAEIGAAATPSTKPELTIAEKNAEFRKRMTEQAEKEKKAADETRVASEKAKRCEHARDYLRTLDAGGRMARVDKNGERTFLTDEQRAQERSDAQKVLAECK